MEETVLKLLEEQRVKIEDIFISVEKTRRYFLWTMILSIAFVVLPLIALAFVLPNFLNMYSSASLGL